MTTRSLRYFALNQIQTLPYEDFTVTIIPDTLTVSITKLKNINQEMIARNSAKWVCSKRVSSPAT